MNYLEFGTNIWVSFCFSVIIYLQNKSHKRFMELSKSHGELAKMLEGSHKREEELRERLKTR